MPAQKGLSTKSSPGRDMWNHWQDLVDDVRGIDGRAIRFGEYSRQLIICLNYKGVSVVGFTSRIEALGLAQSGDVRELGRAEWGKELPYRARAYLTYHTSSDSPMRQGLATYRVYGPQKPHLGSVIRLRAH